MSFLVESRPQGAVAETAGKLGMSGSVPGPVGKWAAGRLHQFGVFVCLSNSDLSEFEITFVCVYSGYHGMGVPVRGQLYRSWVFASARWVLRIRFKSGLATGALTNRAILLGLSGT